MENGQNVAACQRITAAKFGDIGIQNKIGAVVERWKQGIEIAGSTLTELCVSYLVLQVALIINAASSRLVFFKRKRH
jgi:hypothetical protein